MAQRRGQLTPQPCENCGSTVNVEKHHDDYAKPLQVRWRCRGFCHKVADLQARQQARTAAA